VASYELLALFVVEGVSEPYSEASVVWRQDLRCWAELVEATSSSVISSRLWSCASTRPAKASSIALRDPFALLHQEAF
jgi:hypothetical protein